MSDLPPSTDLSVNADPQLQARAAGYGWNEIDDHIAQASVAASNEGYSQDEIDQHLGYSDPSLMEDTAQKSWGETLVDPKVQQSVAAGEAPDLTANPTYRDAYVNAMDQRHVKGPQDFSDRYAVSMVNAAGGMDINKQTRDSLLSTAANAADALAPTLPNSHDLADAALSLPGDPSQNKTNLLNHWRGTGQPPVDAAVQAANDPALQAKLSAPPPTPPPSTPYDPVALYGMGGSDPQNVANILQSAYNYWAQPSELAKQVEEDGARIDKALKEGQSLAQILKGGGDIINSPAFAIALSVGPGSEGSISDIFKNLPEPKVDVLNPGADQPVTQVAASEAFKPVEPAQIIEPEVKAPVEGETAAEPEKPQIDPEAAPAEKLQTLIGAVMPRDAVQTPEFQAKLDRMETMRLTREGHIPDEFDQPNLFTSLYKQSVENGTMAADPAVEKLAQGHDVASGFRSFIIDSFSALMKDERGAMNIGAFFYTPEELAAKAARVENRNYARELMIKTAGQLKQDMREWATKLGPMMKPIDDHLDEWRQAIKLGPAGNAGDTVIGKWLNHIEGRSSGTTFDPSNELAPFADTVREANQAIDKRLRQQAVDGIANYAGYIHDYFVHQFKNPSDVLQNLGVQSGKLGARGNLMERKGPPTITEAVAAGAELKDDNPFNMVMNDLHAKLAYSHAADMFDQMHKDGFTRWDNQKLPGDVPVGTSFGKKYPPIEEVAKGAPRELTLYAHPELVKNLNYWLNRSNVSSTTAKVFENLLYMKNTLTGIKLAAPLFHATVASFASVFHSFGQGMEELFRGQIGDALSHMVGAPLAPFRHYAIASGKNIPYLTMSGDPRLIQLAKDALVNQNFNFGGQHVLERFGGNTPSVYTSLLAGRSLADYVHNPDLGLLPREVKDSFKSILGTKDEPDLRALARMPDRFVQTAIRESGRVLSLVNAPLFEGAIPMMKYGAALDRMNSFLKTNPTDAQFAKYSRQVVQAVDNNFGELQLDNLFWPRMAKVLSNISLISTSWVYGTYRWFASALGRNLEGHAWEWNPVATSNLIAAGATFAAANGLMTYIHTGHAPDSWHDLVNFRTGGVGSGLAKGAPERGMIPSELKEVFDLGTVIAKSWQEPTHAGQASVDYALQKFNPMWQIARAMATGQDGIGHNIAEMPGGWPKYAEQQLLPIAVEQVANMHLGTGLNKVESFVGLREAPKWIENWPAYQSWQAYNETKLTKQELLRARHEQGLGGIQAVRPTTGYGTPLNRTYQRAAPATNAYGTPIGGGRQRAVPATNAYGTPIQ